MWAAEPLPFKHHTSQPCRWCCGLATGPLPPFLGKGRDHPRVHAPPPGRGGGAGGVPEGDVRAIPPTPGDVPVADTGPHLPHEHQHLVGAHPGEVVPLVLGVRDRERGPANGSRERSAPGPEVHGGLQRLGVEEGEGVLLHLAVEGLPEVVAQVVVVLLGPLRGDHQGPQAALFPGDLREPREQPRRVSGVAVAEVEVGELRVRQVPHGPLVPHVAPTP